MENTVYIVFEEKNWKNCEYCDVVSVHTTKEKAVESLNECVKDFQNNHIEEINDILNNDYSYEEKTRHDFYSFLDECMGHYYEVSIKEMNLD